jgi:hypothetical protein
MFCRQELWPLDHRGGRRDLIQYELCIRFKITHNYVIHDYCKSSSCHKYEHSTETFRHVLQTVRIRAIPDWPISPSSKWDRKINTYSLKALDQHFPILLPQASRSVPWHSDFKCVSTHLTTVDTVSQQKRDFYSFVFYHLVGLCCRFLFVSVSLLR